MLTVVLVKILDTIFDLIAVFCIVTLFSDYLRWKRKREIIMVDMAALFDIVPILKRGVMWVQNNPNNNLNDYLQAHLSECLPFPTDLLKAIKYQNAGYTLVFYTEMPNCTRPQLAKLLNNWHLKGDLCLNFNDDFGDPAQFRELCIYELQKHSKNGSKVKGIIDTYRRVNANADKYYAQKGIKIC